MNIQNAARIAPREVSAQNGQKPSQHDQIYLKFIQRFNQLFFKGGLPAQFLPAYDPRRNTCIGGTLQRVSSGIAGYDKTYLAGYELFFSLCVDQSLEIGPPSRYEHGDPGFLQHIRIFSSPAVISPSTYARQFSA